MTPTTMVFDLLSADAMLRNAGLMGISEITVSVSLAIRPYKMQDVVLYNIS